jgi:membrane protease subunit (stomatin/prohibitin family)
MGLMNWMKNQTIDIIEWLDDSNNTLVWRFPRHENEIKNGAKMTVREGQIALCIHEGQMGDVFTPGMYTLSTQNIPILTSLKSWKYGFESPFKIEVYFINTRQYTDMTWGTFNPIHVSDPDLGRIRVRAHGIYGIKVKPEGAPTFFREVVGTDGHFTTDEIETRLRTELVSSLTSVVASANQSIEDMLADNMKLAEQCQEMMAPSFESLGIELCKFVIGSISLPPEIQDILDERAKIRGLGSMGNYMAGYAQHQHTQAMRDAASNPGGMASMGVGFGAAMSMGNAMGQSMGGMVPAQPAQPAPVAQPVAAAAPQPSVADRLKSLKQLQEQGLIDDETFAAKRDAILADI